MAVDRDLNALLHDLVPISLETCNALASMQDRIDNKYLLDFSQFQDFLDAIRASYTVLEIDGKRQFSYFSCYYDDRFSCYFEHHQGRRQRLKVRTREYVDGGERVTIDSGLSFDRPGMGDQLIHKPGFPESRIWH